LDFGHGWCVCCCSWWWKTWRTNNGILKIASCKCCLSSQKDVHFLWWAEPPLPFFSPGHGSVPSVLLLMNSPLPSCQGVVLNMNSIWDDKSVTHHGDKG
jgi:hypothetical protein